MMKMEVSFSLLITALFLTVNGQEDQRVVQIDQNGFSLCKDPGLFTPEQAIDVECANVNEVVCWNIPGFRWNDGENECVTELWEQATSTMRTTCTDAGGTPTDRQTCADHQVVVETYLMDNNVSTEVALTTQTCATLLTGDTLGLRGSFYTFIHATTVCCGGQPNLGACDPDEQSICADNGYYSPRHYLRMRCYGVDQQTCEDELPGFVWTMDRQHGHDTCTGPYSGQSACTENMGVTSPELTCAELNTIFALLEARYQLDFETQAGCDAFFANVSSEFGQMDEVNAFLTSSFLSYVGAPLCCDGMPTVCTADDPYLVCANPDDFMHESPVRLECHGISRDECMELNGFGYDFDESTCITDMFMEANEGYDGACRDAGGAPVETSTCAQAQASLTSYFTEIEMSTPSVDGTCERLLSELTDPLTALYWFEHMPTACCGGLASACEFEPIQVCSDPSQFTPDAPARVRCNGITDEQCGALGSKGFRLEKDGVCKTRVFEPISNTVEADCMDIGGFPKVEATCELTQTVATYLLGEHQVYDLSSNGQCGVAADAMHDDPEYAVYLFKHVPTVCCGGGENSVCTANDVADTCDNQVLFYQAPELDDCGDPLADNFTDSTCAPGCIERVQSIIDSLGCCTPTWLDIVFGDAETTSIEAWDRILQVCAANATAMENCATTSPDGSSAPVAKSSILVVLVAVATARFAQR